MVDLEQMQGVFTALVTPFDTAGKPDLAAFERLIFWQIEQGIHGIVPCGTTGEAATLTFEEHTHLVEVAVKSSGGRVPVMAGTGSNNTAEAILLTKAAEDAGADAALVITPYYNKPTQEGLYQHFSAICAATGLPVVLYDVPGRTVTALSDDLIVRLVADHPQIIGLKDATGDIGRVTRLAARISRPFLQLSGDDSSSLAYYACGGMGAVSVTANIAPKLCARVFEAVAEDDWETARTLNQRLMPLHDGLFVESSPAPAKYALAQMKKCANTLRLPLCPLSKNGAVVVDKALAAAV